MILPIANFAHVRFPVAIFAGITVADLIVDFDLVTIHNYHLRDSVLVFEYEILASSHIALFPVLLLFPVALAFHRSSSIPSICIGIRSIKSSDLSYKIEVDARPPFPLSLFSP